MAVLKLLNEEVYLKTPKGEVLIGHLIEYDNNWAFWPEGEGRSCITWFQKKRPIASRVYRGWKAFSTLELEDFQSVTNTRLVKPGKATKIEKKAKELFVAKPRR